MRLNQSHIVPVFSSTVIVLLLGVVSWSLQNNIKNNAREEVSLSLTTVLDTAHQAAKSWLDGHKKTTQSWARSSKTRELTKQLLELPKHKETLVNSPIQLEIREHARHLLEDHGYQEFFIVSPDYLNLASSRDQYVGMINLLEKEENFFQRIQAGETALSLPKKSAVLLPEADNKNQGTLPTIFVGAPILDASGKIMAVFALQIRSSKNVLSILQKGRIGKSGETYAFDSQARLISHSRFVQQLHESGLLASKEQAIFNIEIRDPGEEFAQANKIFSNTDRPLTRMAASAIKGESGIDLEGYRDYRGTEVVGAWRWDENLGFGIATELDKNEAYQSAQTTSLIITGFTILTGLLLIGLVMFFIVYRQRKTTEQHWHNSETRLRILLDSVGEGVFGVDLEGNCTFINSTGLNILGYQEASELVGKYIHDVIHHTTTDGNPCDEDTCRIYAAFRNGASYFVDDEILWRADGTSIEVEYRSNPIYTDGKITGSVANFSDITARRQAEHALRLSEQRYRQVFNSILDVYAEIDIDGTILEVSPSVKTQTQYTREELLGRFMGDFYARPGDREKLLERIYQDGMINDYETLLVDKDGTHRSFSFTGRVITDENNKPVKLAGVMRDISGRKQAEEILRQGKMELEARIQERTAELEVANEELKHEINERRLTEIALRTERDNAQRYLDTVEAIIISLDNVGCVRLINRKGCQLLGYTEQELLGKNWFTTCLPQPQGMKEVFPAFEKIMSGDLKSVEHYENPVMTRDGRERLIAWHNSYFRDSQGNIIGTLSAGEDITDRVQAEESARQHQAEVAHLARLNIVGEMTTGIAHELNQPLSAIVTYADVALRLVNSETPHRDKLIEVLEGSQSQANRAAEIIRHLRQLVSKKPPVKSETDLNNLIKELAKLAGGELHKHRIKLNLKLEENLPPVEVDDIQIEQVLLNLINNSVEALESRTEANRELSIQTKSENGNSVQTLVIDNGPGIDEQTRQQIFEPFITTKGERGMGMGLSISRSIIEAHQGRLTVKSTPGHGAIFSFTLPLKIKN